MGSLVRSLAASCALLVLAAAPAHAETRTFQGVRFETPDRLVEFRGGPRPGGPFLRLRNGERTDPHSEFIEVMSGPEAAFEGRISRENYADIVLMPASMYCGRHEVLRNTTRNEGGAQIIDVGYVCYDHSRSPEFSRQVVRSTAVFHNDKFTGFMFVRMWLKEPPHADDQLTQEEWRRPPTRSPHRSNVWIAGVRPTPQTTWARSRAILQSSASSGFVLMPPLALKPLSLALAQTTQLK